MKKIVITIPMDEISKKRIEKIAFDKEIIYMESKDVTAEVLENCEIIMGNILPSLLQNRDNIKWIQLNSAGANNYVEIISPKTILTSATGAYGLAVSEHMLALVFALQKKLNLYINNQKDRLWKDEGSVNSIFNSKTLVVGLGDIGSEFAKKMNALGSKVYGIRKNIYEVPDYLEDVYKLEQLDEILGDFDIIAMSLPETKETKDLFSKDKFDKMKKSAILINVGRGSCIVSKDLCEALNNEKIGGAGIDVTHIEPLPQEDELWRAKNLIITPHIAGGYHLEETLKMIREISIENLQAYYENKPLKNIIDLKTGYKKFFK